MVQQVDKQKSKITKNKEKRPSGGATVGQLLQMDLRMPSDDCPAHHLHTSRLSPGSKQLRDSKIFPWKNTKKRRGRKIALSESS